MGRMPALCWRKAALLLMPAVAAEAREVVTAVAEAREAVTAAVVVTVEVAAAEVAVEAAAVHQQPSRAVEVEAARVSNAAVAARVLSSSDVAAGARSFAAGLISAAARTCVCVPALASPSGGAATAGVTAIADRASACTSEEAAVGVIGIIGAGACCATVTRITIGGIATDVGGNTIR